MAHKAGAGSTKNGRDSKAKRLGIKCAENQHVSPGTILVRQRGTKKKAGMNVACGKDHTLFALMPGFVHFTSNGSVSITESEHNKQE